MRAALAIVVVVVAASGCTSLLSPEPTPEPGAAATLTRSLRTPIPTSASAASPSIAASPVPSRVAVGASPSALPVGRAAADDDARRVQQRIETVFTTSNLSGLDALLLDHVSLSTSQGGSVMDAAGAASWLRTHAGPTVKVNRIEQGTQSPMLQVVTDGWPPQDPIQQGQVILSLRKYDATGRQDDETGDWKIDVIDAE